MTDLSPIWNQKLLKPPPICNLKIEVTVNNIDKLKSLKQLLDKCLTVLDDDTAISSEIFILSRLIYKRNLQLRREKTMQFLKQIEKCIKRYIDMDIKKHIVNLKKSFDEVEIRRGISIYLPSQQMLQFLLVKIVSLTMLLSQTIFYCYQAFLWCRMGLDHGHLVPQYLLYISVTSRIWAVCKSQYLHCINWYRRLFPLQNILQATQVEWLSSKDTLPKDLEVFVKKNSQSHLQCTSGISQTKVESMIQQYFKDTSINKDTAIIIDSIEDVDVLKTDDNDGMNIDDIGDNNPTKAKEPSQNVEENDLEEDMEYKCFEEDLGAPVTRDPIKPLRQTQTLAKPTRICDSFKDLIDVMNTYTQFLTQKQKKCLETLKQFQIKYRVAKQNGKGAELKAKLFPKALKKVNLFLKSYKTEGGKYEKDLQLPRLVWGPKSKKEIVGSKSGTSSCTKKRKTHKDEKMEEKTEASDTTNTDGCIETGHYLQMVKNSQNIADLMEVIQMCDKHSHSIFSEPCMQSLQNMNQKFCSQKLKARQKTLVKAKSKVIKFIQNPDRNTENETILEHKNDVSESKSVLNNNVSKFEMKSVSDLVKVLEKVQQKKEIEILDNISIPLDQIKHRLVLKKLKLCHQKLNSSELKPKQRQRLLLKTSNIVMNILNK